MTVPSTSSYASNIKSSNLPLTDKLQRFLDKLSPMEKENIDFFSPTSTSRCQHPTNRQFGCCGAGLVYYPSSYNDMVTCLYRAKELNLHIIPYGKGLSVVGKRPCAIIESKTIQQQERSLSTADSVVLDFCHLNRLLQVNVEDREVTVQAGITRAKLNEQLQPYGLFFPNDPNLDATIGGMLSANSDGPLATGYGFLHDNVISILVMHSDGSMHRYGRHSIFNHWFIGTIGRLGVILEATLQVYPIPKSVSCILVPKESSLYSHTLDATLKLKTTTIPNVKVARCEVLDSAMMKQLIPILKKNAVEVSLIIPESPAVLIDLHLLNGAKSPEEAVRELERIVVDLKAVYVEKDIIISSQKLWNCRYQVWSMMQQVMACKMMVPPSHCSRAIQILKDMGHTHNVPMAVMTSSLVGCVHVLMLTEDKSGIIRDEKALLDNITTMISLARQRISTEAQGSIYWANEPYSTEAEYNMLTFVANIFDPVHLFREL